MAKRKSAEPALCARLKKMMLATGEIEVSHLWHGTVAKVYILEQNYYPYNLISIEYRKVHWTYCDHYWNKVGCIGNNWDYAGTEMILLRVLQSVATRLTKKTKASFIETKLFSQDDHDLVEEQSSMDMDILGADDFVEIEEYSPELLPGIEIEDKMNHEGLSCSRSHPEIHHDIDRMEVVEENFSEGNGNALGAEELDFFNDDGAMPPAKETSPQDFVMDDESEIEVEESGDTEIDESITEAEVIERLEENELVDDISDLSSLATTLGMGGIKSNTSSVQSKDVEANVLKMSATLEHLAKLQKSNSQKHLGGGYQMNTKVPVRPDPRISEALMRIAGGRSFTGKESGSDNWDSQKIVKALCGQPHKLAEATFSRPKNQKTYFFVDTSGSVAPFGNFIITMITSAVKSDNIVVWSGSEAHPNRCEKSGKVLAYEKSFAKNMEQWLKLENPEPDSTLVFWGDLESVNMYPSETKRLLGKFRCIWLHTAYPGTGEVDNAKKSGMKLIHGIFSTVTLIKGLQSIK